MAYSEADPYDKTKGLLTFCVRDFEGLSIPDPLAIRI
jgi:hypothetical protein